MRTTVAPLYGRSGKPVANQYVIYLDDGTRIFQSYGSAIARRSLDGSVVLDRDKWDYSRTTARYRNQFLGESTKETERKIKDGTYRLEDLNE